MTKRYTHKKQRLFKRRRGGTLPFTPRKLREEQQALTPLAPIKLAKQPSRTLSNGQSVRNLTRIFEEKALQPLEVIYGHTQHNKPNTPKIRNNQSNVKKHVIMKQIQPNIHNTVRKTNKLRPPKQQAITQTHKHNQKKTDIFKVQQQPGQTLKSLNIKPKTARQYINNNNIQHLANIWQTEQD